MIATEHDAIVADELNEVSQRLGPLDERVVEKAAEIAAGQSGVVHARLRPRLVRAVEAADVIGQEAAAVNQHDREPGEPVERAAEDQARGRQGRLERIADQVMQVVAPESLDGLEEKRMQHDRRGEVRGRLPERIERGVAERLAERVRIDHRAEKPEVAKSCWTVLSVSSARKIFPRCISNLVPL